MLQDSNYENNDEVAAIAKIEQKLIKSGILKELINFFKKLIIPKRCLHLALKEHLQKYLMFDA